MKLLLCLITSKTAKTSKAMILTESNEVTGQATGQVLQRIAASQSRNSHEQTPLREPALGRKTQMGVDQLLRSHKSEN